MRPKSSRPLSPRVVMGVLSDIWQMAADRVGKIRVIDDPKVCLFPLCYFKGFYSPNCTSRGAFLVIESNFLTSLMKLGFAHEKNVQCSAY